MHAIGKKVLELFEFWAWKKLDEIKVAMAETETSGLEFQARVRKELAVEYRKAVMERLRRFTDDAGIEHHVVEPAGLVELRNLRKHPAFRRTYACATCIKRSGRALKWCKCPSPMQTYIDRECDEFAKDYRTLLDTSASTEDVQKLVLQKVLPNKRLLMLRLLQLREVVEHYNFYGDGTPKPKELMADPREREPLRAPIKLVKEVWKDDNTLLKSETTEMAGTDSTSRLYVDLQGWDRPSAPSKRTQRLAYCGHCESMGNNPWFWVARKRVNGQYERSPFALTAHCPVCKSLEVKPEPRPPRTDIQFVARKVRRNGKAFFEFHTFYRNRGVWVNLRNDEVTHTELNHKLQLRWRSIRPLRINA